MTESKLLLIEQHPGYVKDTGSGAILNTDSAKLAAYKKQKQIMARSIANEERIETLEKDIGEIKNMLEKLVKAIG